MNNYEANTNPASNLRNLRVASHSEGLKPNINIGAKKTQENNLEKATKSKSVKKSLLDTKKANKTEAHAGNGLWLTKKFF